jgi:phosphatidylserine/phosphatidylglycerophosphate/cardiolipin synthase-like enzyme
MTAGPIPAIRALSVRVLTDLAEALRSGRLAASASVSMIRFAVPAASEIASAEATSLLSSGMAAEHAALLFEAIAADRAAEARSGEVEVVSSGPDSVGATRDTGVVLRELFAAAEQRVLIVGFAVHQGRDIFAVLAQRMLARPALSVRLCLDVRRAPGDTTRSDALLHRFADRFLKHEWPGPRIPEVFYDPRSLIEGGASHASLHAKCVVIDGMKVFVGSANFTEAAQHRNIEIGLVTSRPDVAASVERHFEGLIERGHLRGLPLRGVM